MSGSEQGMQRTYTIAEAVEVTGLTVKALRNRCDRGQLRFLTKGGVRRIPLTELRRAGLLLADGPGAGELEPAAIDGGEARELVSRELLSELAAAHETIGTLRALEERSRGTEAELEVSRRLAAAELERRRELELELAELRRRSLLDRIRNR